MGAAIVVAIAAVVPAQAQDLEPRAYANAPVGVNFLIVGYGYSQGSVVFDPSSPIKDAAAKVHSAVLAYVRSLDLWGRPGKFDIVLPYAWGSGTAKIAGQPSEREVSGPVDPRFRLSVLVYGAPALSLAEFTDYQPDLIVGASLTVTAPLGQYDSTKVVNIGTNRWSVKPELGVSKTLGPWTLELITGVTFYTKNDDFLGGKTLERDPLYSVQGHLIHHFGSGVWAALNGTYYAGGRPMIDGEKGGRHENVRLGVTVSIPIDRRNSLKLYGSTGAYSRAGSDFDTVGISWQHNWGGGR